MLFGDGDVEITLRVASAEGDQVGAFFHRWRNAGQAWISGGHVAQPLAKDRGILRPGGLLWRRRRDWLALADSVIADWVCLGRGKSLTFTSNDMQKLRPFELAYLAQIIQKAR